MPRRGRQWILFGGLVILLVLVAPSSTVAVHESTNVLVFAPVDTAMETSAQGDGSIEYRGGDASESRWTAMFDISGLEPSSQYVVVVLGRYGADGSDEASVYSEICSFTTDGQGSGGCWYYFVVLERLTTVQIREGSNDGPAILQATRTDGPGSISSQPNTFSPDEATPASPAATPHSTPLAGVR